MEVGSNGRKPRRRNCGLAPGSSFLLMSSLSLFCIFRICILYFPYLYLVYVVFSLFVQCVFMILESHLLVYFLNVTLHLAHPSYYSFSGFLLVNLEVKNLDLHSPLKSHPYILANLSAPLPKTPSLPLIGLFTP